MLINAMLNPAYTVLTNDDLLKQIAKWHIIPYLNSPIIINLLSQDKNIDKLIWLLNEKHINLEILDKITQKYTTPHLIIKPYNNLDFFDYAIMVGSPKILNYYSHTTTLTWNNILNTTYDILGHMIMYLFGKNPNTLLKNDRIAKLEHFILFYNNLPSENKFNEIIISFLKNSESITDFATTTFNLNSDNKYEKDCCLFCKKSSQVEAIEDKIIKFLLKSKLLTLTQIDTTLNTDTPNASILYFIYKGYNNSLEYILQNNPHNIQILNSIFCPEVSQGSVFNIQLCNYLMMHNPQIIYTMIENGIYTLYDNLIDYVITYKTMSEQLIQPVYHVWRDGIYCSTNEDDLLPTDTIDKQQEDTIKFNVGKKLFEILKNYKTIISFIQNHTASEIMQVKKFRDINQLKYNDMIMETIMSMTNPDFTNKFLSMTPKQKNICINFFINNNHIKNIKPVMFDPDLTINFNKKIDLLIKLKLYANAYDYICDYKGEYDTLFNIKYLNKIATNYDKEKRYIFPDFPVLHKIISYDDIKHIHQITRNILTLEQNLGSDIKIQNMYTKLEVINFNKNFVELEKVNKFKTLIYICEYIEKQNFPYEISKILNSLIICYIPNFEHYYHKLTLEMKYLCVNYLLSLNNIKLLEKVIFDKDITIITKTKIQVLINMNLLDEALDIIYNFGPSLMLNISLDNVPPLFSYICSNHPQDIMKFIGIIGTIKSEIFSYFPNHSVITDCIISLPKTISNFPEVFIALCDILIVPSTDLANKYSLNQHLQYFINNIPENEIIKNIIVQNMLNKGQLPQFPLKNKLITLTPNIYKKNIKNINHIIQNFVIQDHRMLEIMYNYGKTIPKCIDIIPVELEIWLQKNPNTIIDDDTILNLISWEDIHIYKIEHLFDFIISNNFIKSLTMYFENMENPIFNKDHVALTKNPETLNILKTYSKHYKNSKPNMRKLPVYVCSNIHLQNGPIN